MTMIAPKGPGHTVRSEYQAGKGVPCLAAAVQQDATEKRFRTKALAYALGIGRCKSRRAGDNVPHRDRDRPFGEQAVLCGGVCALMQAGFETW